MAELVSRTSWDRTASAIEALLQGLLQARPVRSKLAANADHANVATVRPGESGAMNSAGRRTPAMRREPPTHPAVILGAGPTGLAAAMHLGVDALLLEKGPAVGGWCRSIEDQGFTFDCAGHIMFSNDECVLALYKTLLGENVHWQNREAWIYSKEVYTRYPFQGALYGLPPEVLKECLVGAIEARFGPLKKEASTSAVAGVIAKPQQAPKNFEEFIYKVWGAGVAKHFAIPYNRKLWAVPLHEMETSWLGGRVPMPDLEEMIEGGLQPVPKPMGPNARFGYPLKGGFQALMDGFLPHLKGPIQLDAEVVAVSPTRRCVTLADGRVFGYDSLISTLPLPKLVEAMGEEAPEAVRTAAQSLRHVSVRCVNLGIGREKLTDKHWIYYPEDMVFHRIFVQGNASPHCNPPGGFGLTCEISYSDYKPLPCEGQALIDRCIADCKRVGLIRDDDPVWAANEVDMPYSYVVYDHARAQHVETIRRWMGEARIVLAGRYSEWEYYNSDHAFLAGRKAAEQVRQLPLATFTSTGGSSMNARELLLRQAAAVAMAAAPSEAGKFKPAA
jgi:protoporphyrinogen oxidase